jgi:oligopeptide transport system substrate-binding protein
MVLERNPRYQGRFKGNADRVELIFPAPGLAPTALELYEADDLDVLYLNRFQPADRDRARQRYAGEHVSWPAPAIYFVCFNPRRSPFDDVRVRRALALGTDREQLARRLAGFGLRFHTGGMVPPGAPGHSTGIALPYDLGEARRLLAEAGYPGGVGFPVVAALTFVTSMPALQALAALWREVLGIQVEWKVLDYRSFVNLRKRKPPHLYVGGWAPGYPDPDTYLRAAVGWVTRRWRNETYEGLVERAKRQADQADRMELYGQADRMLLEEGIVVPLGYRQDYLLIKPWVSRYPISPFRLSFWKDVVIEPH